MSNVNRFQMSMYIVIWFTNSFQQSSVHILIFSLQGGKQPKLGKVKDGHTNLYKPPTMEELNMLRETQMLYHSNLFRMQVWWRISLIWLHQINENDVGIYGCTNPHAVCWRRFLLIRWMSCLLKWVWRRSIASSFHSGLQSCQHTSTPCLSLIQLRWDNRWLQENLWIWIFNTQQHVCIYFTFIHISWVYVIVSYFLNS